VFDGRRRYDLVARDEGSEHLPPWPAAPQGADARRCAIDVIKLAGFSSDAASSEHVDHGEVWLAPPRPGAPPLPVRLTFASDWGQITVRLGAPPAG
jgi:hypothetical protein